MLRAGPTTDPPLNRPPNGFRTNEEQYMRIARQDIPVILGIPGATARQAGGFGELSGGGDIAAEWFSLGADRKSTRLNSSH